MNIGYRILIYIDRDCEYTKNTPYLGPSVRHGVTLVNIWRTCLCCNKEVHKWPDVRNINPPNFTRIQFWNSYERSEHTRKHNPFTTAVPCKKIIVTNSMNWKNWLIIVVECIRWYEKNKTPKDAHNSQFVEFCCVFVLGWGLLSQFPPFRHFPKFSS